MKDKEKQIEEMAKIMCSPCPDGKECFGTWCYKRVLDCANEFHNQGYRKLYEDSVVLSREEYAKLKLAKDICCHDLFIATKQSHEEGYKRGYDKGKYEARKETAEKILKDLIKNCEYTFGIDGKPIIKLDGDFALNVAKQFGVEIKE